MNRQVSTTAVRAERGVVVGVGDHPHAVTAALPPLVTGLCTYWGVELATRMLAEAGFDVGSVSDAPEDPVDVVYLCRRR